MIYNCVLKTFFMHSSEHSLCFLPRASERKKLDGSCSWNILESKVNKNVLGSLNHPVWTRSALQCASLYPGSRSQLFLCHWFQTQRKHWKMLKLYFPWQRKVNVLWRECRVLSSKEWLLISVVYSSIFLGTEYPDYFNNFYSWLLLGFEIIHCLIIWKWKC